MSLDKWLELQEKQDIIEKQMDDMHLKTGSYRDFEEFNEIEKRNYKKLLKRSIELHDKAASILSSKDN